MRRNHKFLDVNSAPVTSCLFSIWNEIEPPEKKNTDQNVWQRYRAFHCNKMISTAACDIAVLSSHMRLTTMLHFSQEYFLFTSTCPKLYTDTMVFLRHLEYC